MAKKKEKGSRRSGGWMSALKPIAAVAVGSAAGALAQAGMVKAGVEAKTAATVALAGGTVGAVASSGLARWAAVGVAASGAVQHTALWWGRREEAAGERGDALSAARERELLSEARRLANTEQ